MSKQDRQGVRNPPDLERKYDLRAIAGLKKAVKVSEEGINKTNQILEEFVTATLQNFKNIESQIDGNIATHFYGGVPTLENVPASEWTTDENKKNHLSDLYYDKDSGRVYEFVFVDEAYCWKETESNAIIEAMALANVAKDTADGKRRIFTEQPVPPYDIGDLWFNEEEIFICDISKLAGESYEDGDFVTATKYTDDSTANKVKVDLQEFMGSVEANYSTTVDMNSAITKSEEKITTSVNKTITEKVDILQQQIDGAIETFTGSAEPTLESAPASEWSTDQEKDTHIGDLYIVNSDGGDLAGFYYRFEKTDTAYRWTLLKDNEVTKALQDAKDANEKAEEIKKNLEENYSNTTEMRSEIEQAADEIKIEVGKKVGTDELISKINVSAEAIELKGNRILIESDNFTLNKDGTITVKNGTFSGTVTAGSGEIGGWKIGEKGIYNDTVKAGFVNIGAFVLYAGRYTYQEMVDASYVSDEYPYFGVTYEGNVFLKTLNAIEGYFDGDCAVFGTLYTSSGTVSLSDRNAKYDEEELDIKQSEKFIYSLKPKKYKYKNGTSGRFHHGFIAQEVKEAMGEEDWGLYVDMESQKEEKKALRYEELIADLVATVQSQNKRIEELEKKIGLS